MTDPTFTDVIAQIQEIATRFSRIEGKPWQAEGAMIELQKQCGDLAKLVMIKEHYYHANVSSDETNPEIIQSKIADELWDIIFCAARLAQHYQIDLLKTHHQVFATTDLFLKSKGV